MRDFMIRQLFEENPFVFSLLVLYALSFLIQMFYYWVWLSGIAFLGRRPAWENNKGVSVILCAKDDFHHLENNLSHILSQNYPTFEVIVVNDNSVDESDLLLESLTKQFSNLKVLRMNSSLNFFKGRKFPLSIGIRSASYDTILLTEVDCKPASPYWIQRMMSAFEPSKEVILGYHAYPASKGVWNKLIRYDHLFSALRFLSFARRKYPFTGTVKNLAFKKSVVQHQKVLPDLYYITAGDDDLFINRIVNRKNTTLQLHPESFTISQPPKSFRGWIALKRRENAGTAYIKLKHRWMLRGYVITQWLFFVLFILLIALFYSPLLVTILFLLREISHAIIIKYSSRKLNERDLFLTSFAGELFMLLINPIIVLAARTTKTTKWR
ncbi:MAG: glycosyltransferase [Bacteroidales bacterium]|nr:glycosyltransferase [Bacteroidales bacterium]